MSIALGEFWTRLLRSGIVDGDGCKRLAELYSNAHNGSPVPDVESLCRFLVDSKTITDFQSKSLLADPPVEIRLGRFVQTSDQATMPLAYWLPVQALSSLPSTPIVQGF